MTGGGETSGGLSGLVVLSFESRRAGEMAELIRRHGGEAIVAPSMREVPLQENSAAFEFLAQLEEGKVDVILLLTGVGTRTLVAALKDRCPPPDLAALFRQTKVVARGPKPVAALREIGLVPDITVPEPNTWREVLVTVDQQLEVRGKTVAVQEYGVTNPELIGGLTERGARVLRVPVYQWALPEDTGPLRAAVGRLARGDAGAVLFTSAAQVHHAMQVAQEMGLADQIRAAAKRVVVASIGPVCSEAIRAHGMPVDLEPEHPKMGQLVGAVARKARDLVERKRSGGARKV